MLELTRCALLPGAVARLGGGRFGGGWQQAGTSAEPAPDSRLRVFVAGSRHRPDAPLARAVAGEAVELTVVGDRRDRLGGVWPGPGLRILRRCPEDSILDELRRAEVVLLPLAVDDSLAGQALLAQAMAYAKPIVAVRTPMAAEYLTDGLDALLVPPGSAGAMREALRRLHRDPALRDRLGRAARRAYVADHPSASCGAPDPGRGD